MTDAAQPASTYPLLPLRDVALQPDQGLPLFIGRPASIAAVLGAKAHGDRLFVVAQRDGQVERPALRDLHGFGTVARVDTMLKLPDGTLKVSLTGLFPAALVAIDDGPGHLQATVRVVEEASDAQLGARPPAGQGERPDDIVEEIRVEGFDAEGEPVFCVERGGNVNLMFEWMPPSWMKEERAEELRCLRALDRGITAAARCETTWDNAETLIIESPAPGALERIGAFLRQFRLDYGDGKVRGD